VKKLTNARRVAVEIALHDARKARDEANLIQAVSGTMNPEWRAQMRIVWDAEGLVKSTLGCSMTRFLALLDKVKTLDDYYYADGTPVKDVK